MSKSGQFEFINFTPRACFAEKANLCLERFVENIPNTSSYKASCKQMRDNQFYFAIELLVFGTSFNARIILDPQKCDTSDRDWQMKVVDQMFIRLIHQMELWRKSRAV